MEEVCLALTGLRVNVERAEPHRTSACKGLGGVGGNGVSRSGHEPGKGQSWIEDMAVGLRRGNGVGRRSLGFIALRRLARDFDTYASHLRAARLPYLGQSFAMMRSHPACHEFRRKREANDAVFGAPAGECYRLQPVIEASRTNALAQRLADRFPCLRQRIVPELVFGNEGRRQ